MRLPKRNTEFAMDNVTYSKMLNDIEDKLPGIERTDFNLQFSEQKKNIVTALVLSLFFGFLGLDRFYLGQTILGLLKLITLGGAGIWVVIDWLLIIGATREKNIQIAEDIRLHDDYGVL